MNIFQDGPIEYKGDGIPEKYVPIKPIKKPKPSKVAPVHTLDREAFLKRKAELEARDHTEIKRVILCPHCGRPM